MIDINSLDRLIESRENEIPNIRTDTEKKSSGQAKLTEKLKQVWYLFMASQQPVLN